MRNRSVHRLLGLVLISGLLSTSLAVAQTVTGSISGAVVDQSGAAVPAAEVHVTNTETNKLYSSASDASGRFHLALLPVGTYYVEVSKANFRKLALSGAARQGTAT